MTRRISAKLVGVACLLVMATAAIATAQAQAGVGRDGERIAGKMYIDPLCPARTVCLFQSNGFRGEEQRYGCQGYARGRVRRAKLSPTIFPPGGFNGVSSYEANVPKATLSDGDEPYPLLTYQPDNITRWFNDDARELVVTC